MVLCTFVLGTVGFMIIGHGRWDFFDCAYMTSITLTTVGYGEVLEQMGRDARLYAMIVMWVGMGVTLYAVSAVTAFLIEKDLWQAIREKKMERKIATLRGHIIVCGAGKTGQNVVKELHTTGHSCVVIDGNVDRLSRVQQQFKDVFCMCGDATEEETLKRAGIENAKGILAILSEDSHNLLIIVQARYVNPNIKIVARCNDLSLGDKFYRAGANYIVSPTFIGGMRMASEMIRPNVVTFLDRMLRGQNHDTRVEEAEVQAGSVLDGLTIREADIYGRTKLSPLALKPAEQEEFMYNPAPDERLSAGTVIIVVGSPAQVAKLKKICAAE